MDRDYWERVGERYEREIFASSLSDTTGVIRRRLDELANPKAVAADFGCGVGHYLPLLARRFRQVHGIDFAVSLLEQARARTRDFDNVTIHRANLASGRARLSFPKVGVAVCANVLISNDESVRRGILRTIRKQMVRGGQLLLLVPSLEAEVYTSQMLAEWNRRQGHRNNETHASGFRSVPDMVQGLVDIEGVLTKHYLREELEVLLANSGFEAASFDKVEYRWDTELDAPPRWITRSPRPWDWLVVAKARG